MENMFPCSLKLIEHSVSLVNVVSSHPCVGSLPRIKIPFLLSICTDELIFTPNIIAILPNPLPFGKEELSDALNPIFILIRIRICSQLNSSK